MASASWRVAILSGVLAACGATQPKATTEPQAVGVPLRLTLAQVDMPNGKAFAVCIEPACPERSPKTVVTGGAVMGPEDRWAGRKEAVRGAGVNAGALVAAPSGPDSASRRVLADIPFATGSAMLTETAKRTLEALLPLVRKGTHVLVMGHTDNRGTAVGNERLAKARAATVTEFIRRNTNRDVSIETRGEGLCCYIAGNETPDGRARNRRAKVILTVSG